MFKKNSVWILFFVVVALGLGILTYKKSQTCGTVIILNGPSAVGKSSILRAFQAKQKSIWLGTGIDNLSVGVLPPKVYLEDKPEHHVIMRGIATEDAEGKLFSLYFGEQGQKVIKGMHRAIAAYARAGNNVIVDYIMYDPAWRDDLMSVLSGVPVIAVGVTAPLHIISEREKLRHTSPEGHARSMYATVHNGWKYDLTVDTSELTPDQIAEQIDAFLKQKTH